MRSRKTGTGSAPSESTWQNTLAKINELNSLADKIKQSPSDEQIVIYIKDSMEILKDFKPGKSTTEFENFLANVVHFFVSFNTKFPEKNFELEGIALYLSFSNFLNNLKFSPKNELILAYANSLLMVVERSFKLELLNLVIAHISKIKNEPKVKQVQAQAFAYYFIIYHAREIENKNPDKQIIDEVSNRIMDDSKAGNINDDPYLFRMYEYFITKSSNNLNRSLELLIIVKLFLKLIDKLNLYTEYTVFLKSIKDGITSFHTIISVNIASQALSEIKTQTKIMLLTILSKGPIAPNKLDAHYTQQLRQFENYHKLIPLYREDKAKDSQKFIHIITTYCFEIIKQAHNVLKNDPRTIQELELKLFKALMQLDLFQPEQFEFQAEMLLTLENYRDPKLNLESPFDLYKKNLDKVQKNKDCFNTILSYLTLCAGIHFYTTHFQYKELSLLKKISEHIELMIHKEFTKTNPIKESTDYRKEFTVYFLNKIFLVINSPYPLFMIPDLINSQLKMFDEYVGQITNDALLKIFNPIKKNLSTIQASLNKFLKLIETEKKSDINSELAKSIKHFTSSNFPPFWLASGYLHLAKLRSSPDEALNDINLAIKYLEESILKLRNELDCEMNDNLPVPIAKTFTDILIKLKDTKPGSEEESDSIFSIKDLFKLVEQEEYCHIAISLYQAFIHYGQLQGLSNSSSLIQTLLDSLLTLLYQLMERPDQSMVAKEYVYLYFEVYNSLVESSLKTTIAEEARKLLSLLKKLPDSYPWLEEEAFQKLTSSLSLPAKTTPEIPPTESPETTDLNLSPTEEIGIPITEAAEDTQLIAFENLIQENFQQDNWADRYREMVMRPLLIGKGVVIHSLWPVIESLSFQDPKTSERISRFYWLFCNHMNYLHEMESTHVITYERLCKFEQDLTKTLRERIMEVLTEYESTDELAKNWLSGNLNTLEEWLSYYQIEIKHLSKKFDELNKKQKDFEDRTKSFEGLMAHSTFKQVKTEATEDRQENISKQNELRPVDNSLKN